MRIPVVFLFLFFLMGSLFAASDVQVSEPTIVNVSVLALNVDRFDVSSGSYIIDFYLTLTCESNCSVDNFEFMNGRALNIDKTYDDGKEKVYRIYGQLAENVDLRDYPFDKHTLTIEMEDKLKTTKELVYLADKNKSGIDERLTFIGWSVVGWDAETREHYYPTFDETYSTYVFKINIERLTLTSIIKIFVPAIFILLISILALFIRPDDPDEIVGRSSIATGALIAEVVFHLSATSSLPPTGYLTFMDKFMFATYLSIFLNLISTVLIMEFEKRKIEIHNKALIIVPTLTLIAFLIVFLSS